MNKFIDWLQGSEILNTLFGYRKYGASESLDNRDFDAYEMYVKSAKTYTKEEVMDFDSVPYQDQQRTPHCVAFACAHACSIMLTNKYGRLITVEGSWIAQHMINDGLMTPKGSYIRDGLKTVLKYGAKDTEGNLYRFEAFGLVPKDKFKETLDKQIPIITGALIGVRMCDNDWFWIPKNYTNAMGGHSFCLPGRDPEKVYGKNSWKNYGVRKGGKGRGRFYVWNQDKDKLMSGFILWGAELVDKK